MVNRTFLNVPFLSTWILSLWNKPFLPLAWVAYKLFIFFYGKKYWNPSTSFSHHSRYQLVHCHSENREYLRHLLLQVKSLFLLCIPLFLLDCNAGCQDFWWQERVFHSHWLIKTAIIQLYSFFHSKPLALQLRNILYYTNHNDLSTMAV